METVRAGLLRSLSFFNALGYAPTLPELILSWDGGQTINDSRFTIHDLKTSLQTLIHARVVAESCGRFTFVNRESLIVEHESREALFPRKLRQARRVASWLSCLSGVRAVCLCNTTALAHARDEGDLDFFVVTHRGSIWQTRGWGALPFQLLDRRPRTDRISKDAVCLSFFVDDSALNLLGLTLPGDDPYFRYWFLSLLPLYDDGVLADFWNANQALVERHSFARPWVLNPDVAISRSAFRVPRFTFLESIAKKIQRSKFSPSIKAMMNQDTRVVVNDHVLKFHVEDGREKFRDQYQKNCQHYGIDA